MTTTPDPPPTRQALTRRFQVQLRELETTAAAIHDHEAHDPRVGDLLAALDGYLNDLVAVHTELRTRRDGTGLPEE